MSYPGRIACLAVTRVVCRSMTMRYDLSVAVSPCHTLGVSQFPVRYERHIASAKYSGCLSHVRDYPPYVTTRLYLTWPVMCIASDHQLHRF